MFFLGLPVQVRDAALKLQDNIPKSDVNKEYYTQNIEREVRIITELGIILNNLKVYFSNERLQV